MRYRDGENRALRSKREYNEKKEAKDKEEQAEEEAKGGERTKSPSTLNARRKIRKFIR